MYTRLKYLFDTFIYLKDLNRIYRIYELRSIKASCRYEAIYKIVASKASSRYETQEEFEDLIALLRLKKALQTHKNLQHFYDQNRCYDDDGFIYRQPRILNESL